MTSPLPRPLARAVGGLALAGVGLAGYATLVEPRAFRLRERTVGVLPPGSPPVRVLHLSDLHQTSGQQAKRDFVRDLARLSPDLTVVTGDFLSSLDAAPAVLDALEPLLALPGAFVPGNNDYWLPGFRNPLGYVVGRHKDGGRPRALVPLPWPELAGALAERGWLDLTHRRATVDLGVQVELVGTDDAHSGRARHARVAGPADPAAALTIAVTHSPEPYLLTALARDGARLLLAGHTHGGQVRVPWRGALTTNCGLPTARARGLSPWGPPGSGCWLHVSAGLGQSPYAPVRFCCPPEATLLTLVAEEESTSSVG